MKLNLFEKWMMINPVRPLFQRYFEARRLLDMGGMAEGSTALEIGCGSGSGIEIIRSIFMVEQLHAFDLDWEMIKLAKNRRRSRSSKTVLWIGNARSLPVRTGHYDAVFTFGAIHHVVDWRAALKEVYRVLKPGGRFYAEEILKKYITHPIWGRLMNHPQGDRFDLEHFETELSATGFEIVESRQFLDLFGWFIADKPVPPDDPPVGQPVQPTKQDVFGF